MTLAETKELLVWARGQRIQELSVKPDGEIHVMFQPGADVPRVPDVMPNLPKTPEAARVEESEAEKLMDDPDLFLHVDGRPDTLEGDLQQ